MKEFVFVFPGQGSQSIKMLSKLSSKYPTVNTIFQKASNILEYDLWNLIKKGPIEELNKTWKTQPAILASSVSIYQIWKEQGKTPPKFMTGYSLGEYSALVCANILKFTDAIKLVELRGKLMQEAVKENEGAMLVIIGLKKNEIQKICKENSLNEVVSPSNFNAPHEIVISGNKKAVERAGIACKIAGAKHIFPLPISIPSHCSLMKPAAKKFEKILKKINFSPPSIPVLNNTTLKFIDDSNILRNALVKQLYNPVYWTKCVKFIISKKINILLEIGPGKILSNLNKRISNTLITIAVNNPTSLKIAFDLIKTKEKYESKK